MKTQTKEQEQEQETIIVEENPLDNLLEKPYRTIVVNEEELTSLKENLDKALESIKLLEDRLYNVNQDMLTKTDWLKRNMSVGSYAERYGKIEMNKPLCPICHDPRCTVY